MFLRLQYQCEFNETNPCFNASANVLYTEQARELAQSGGIDDVALEEMSEAEKQAELAKREAEKASQAFQKWVRISRILANARSKNQFFSSRALWILIFNHARLQIFILYLEIDSNFFIGNNELSGNNEFDLILNHKSIIDLIETNGPLN